MTELSRLLVALNVALLPHLENGCVNYSSISGLRLQFLDHCNLLIKKNQFIVLQEACIDYFKLWNQFGGEVAYEKDAVLANVTYAFENTLFFILVSCSLLLFLFCLVLAVYLF